MHDLPPTAEGTGDGSWASQLVGHFGQTVSVLEHRGLIPLVQESTTADTWQPIWQPML